MTENSPNKSNITSTTEVVVTQQDSDSPGRSEGHERSVSPTEDDEYRTDLTNIIISSETTQPNISRYDVIHKVSPEVDTPRMEACPMETNAPIQATLKQDDVETDQGGKTEMQRLSSHEQSPVNQATSDVDYKTADIVSPVRDNSEIRTLYDNPVVVIQAPTPLDVPDQEMRELHDTEIPPNESTDSISSELITDSQQLTSEPTPSVLMSRDDEQPVEMNEMNGDLSMDLTSDKNIQTSQIEYLDNSEEALTLNVNESLNSSVASSGQDKKGGIRGGAENFDEISDIENWDDIEGGDDELWKLSFQPSVAETEERDDEEEKDVTPEESRGMREQMSPISSGDEFGEAEDKEKYFQKGEDRDFYDSEGKSEMIGQSILVIGGGAASHGRYQSRSRDRGFEFNEPLSPAPNDSVPKQLDSKSANSNLTRIVKLSEDATSDISDSSFKDTMDDYEDSKIQNKRVKSRHSRVRESSSHPRDLPFSDKLFVDAKYFIMKSNNHENIRIAKEKYAWSTPLPNEKKLSQSYRQHKNIILLFSVRESGRFQGFARLASDVKRSGPPIQWHLPHGINANSLGGIFRLQWVSKEDLEFSRCQDVSNPWNDNKPVKISRDGQELPPAIGEKLCRLWFERPDTPPNISSPSKTSNSNLETSSTSPTTHQPTTTTTTTTSSASTSATPFPAPAAQLPYPTFPYPYGMQPSTTTPHNVQLQNYLAQAQQHQLLVAQGVRPPASYTTYPYIHQQLQNYAAMAQSMQAFSQANKMAMWNAESQHQRKAMAAAAMNYLKEAAAFTKTKSPKNRTPSPTSKRRRTASDSSSKRSHHDLRHALRGEKEKLKESRSYHRSNSSRSAKTRHSSSSKHRRYSSSRKYSSSKIRKGHHANRSRTHSSSPTPQEREYESENRNDFKSHESPSSPESIELSPSKDPTQEFGVNKEILLHGSYDDYLKEMQQKGVHSAAGLGRQKSRENT